MIFLFIFRIVKYNLLSLSQLGFDRKFVFECFCLFLLVIVLYLFSYTLLKVFSDHILFWLMFTKQDKDPAKISTFIWFSMFSLFSIVLTSQIFLFKWSIFQSPNVQYKPRMKKHISKRLSLFFHGIEFNLFTK